MTSLTSVGIRGWIEGVHPHHNTAQKELGSKRNVRACTEPRKTIHVLTVVYYLKQLGCPIRKDYMYLEHLFCFSAVDSAVKDGIEATDH